MQAPGLRRPRDGGRTPPRQSSQMASWASGRHRCCGPLPTRLPTVPTAHCPLPTVPTAHCPLPANCSVRDARCSRASPKAPCLHRPSAAPHPRHLVLLQAGHRPCARPRCVAPAPPRPSPASGRLLGLSWAYPIQRWPSPRPWPTPPRPSPASTAPTGPPCPRGTVWAI